MVGEAAGGRGLLDDHAANRVSGRGQQLLPRLVGRVPGGRSGTCPRARRISGQALADSSARAQGNCRPGEYEPDRRGCARGGVDSTKVPSRVCSPG